MYTPQEIGIPYGRKLCMIYKKTNTAIQKSELVNKSLGEEPQD